MNPVLALALAASLATSATDSFTRIPGTRLGLGMTESLLKDRGEFTGVKAKDAEGATSLGGTVKFFGVPCTATLYLRGGVLERAHFEAQQVAPHTLDYVEDQLRREKLWRECVRLEPTDRVCDWIGAVKIKLEFHKDRLDAMVEAAPRPWEELDSTRNVVAAVPTVAKVPAPASAPAKAPSIAADTSAPPPASDPAKASSIAAPAPATSGTKPKATAKLPAASAPAKAPSSAAATPARVTPPAPALPAPATTLPATEKAPPSSAAATTHAPATGPAVATLPETLRISLPERNPPTVWPRMSSIPPLEYPAAAKRDSLEGVVWVMTLVDADGSVRSTHIDRGIPALNDAALAWVSKAHFAPCERDGRPCRFWVRVAARFTLE